MTPVDLLVVVCATVIALAVLATVDTIAHHWRKP